MDHNKPAFPNNDLGPRKNGMTLRDWFAGQALGYALDRDYGNDWGKSGREHIPKAAAHAYRIADAMLAERERS